MDKIIPVSEVRSKLPELVKNLKKDGQHLVITKNGRPAAILMSPEELETLEIMADRKLMSSIASSLEQIKKGKLFS